MWNLDVICFRRFNFVAFRGLCGSCSKSSRFFVHGLGSNSRVYKYSV